MPIVRFKPAAIYNEIYTKVNFLYGGMPRNDLMPGFEIPFSAYKNTLNKLV